MSCTHRVLAALRTCLRACGAVLASLVTLLSAYGAEDAPQLDRSSTWVPRVAIVLNGSPSTHRNFYEAFLEGVNALGYQSGRNVVLDVRWAEARLDRLPEILSELLRLKPDVIVVAGSQAVRAAKAATSSVPIVMAAVGDPVAQGFIASLARPGGNLTGIAVPSEALMSKILERLHQIVPRASRIAVLANPSNPVHALVWKQTEATAKKLGVSLQRFDASGLGELEQALNAIANQRPHALVVGADALFNSFRGRIARFALSNRIPSGYFFSEAVAEGGLMSYSSSISECYFRAATYVHRILNGAKPQDLPVEQPGEFELQINTRVAKALGITIPQSVIASADKLID